MLTRRELQRGTKILPIAGGKFVAGEPMVLRAARFDLDRAEQRSDPAGGLPVPAMNEPVKQARPISVATSGGIDHRFRPGRRDDDFAFSGMNLRALRAPRDDQRLDVVEYLGFAPAGALLDHLP